MHRVMLDSNGLDLLLTLPRAYETLNSAVEAGELVILFTHVTVDEMAAIPDLEKRRRLLLFLIRLGRLIDTSGACADFSRSNFCRASRGGNDFELLRSGNIRHSRDALIAQTAMDEQCTLITNERRLAGRAREQGVRVMTTAELLGSVNLASSSAPPRSL